MFDQLVQLTLAGVWGRNKRRENSTAEWKNNATRKELRLSFHCGCCCCFIYINIIVVPFRRPFWVRDEEGTSNSGVSKLGKCTNEPCLRKERASSFVLIITAALTRICGESLKFLVLRFQGLIKWM